MALKYQVCSLTSVTDSNPTSFFLPVWFLVWFCFGFGDGTGVSTQGLVFAKQVVYHLSHAHSSTDLLRQELKVFGFDQALEVCKHTPKCPENQCLQQPLEVPLTRCLSSEWKRRVVMGRGNAAACYLQTHTTTALRERMAVLEVSQMRWLPNLLILSFPYLQQVFKIQPPCSHLNRKVGHSICLLLLAFDTSTH
jgi:hypothetical protein